MYLFATAVTSSITSIVFVELFYLSSVLEILRVTLWPHHLQKWQRIIIIS